MQFLLRILRSTTSTAAAAGEPNTVVAGSAAVPLGFASRTVSGTSSVGAFGYFFTARTPSLYARLFFCGWIGCAVSLGTGVILSSIAPLGSKLWIAIGVGGLVLGTLGSVKEFWGSDGLTVDKKQEKPSENPLSFSVRPNFTLLIDSSL